MNTQITVFEKILAGEIPCKKVFEDEFALAFYDINPQAPIHVLVIPKRKIVSFAELAKLGNGEVSGYMFAIQKTAEQLGLNSPGYRVVFNCGENGGQEVPYLHAHILAGRRMTWPPG